MTWYVIIFDKKGEIRDHFQSDKSLRDVLDEIATKLETTMCFAIFTDKKTFFIMLMKRGWADDVIREITGLRSFRDMTTGYWDFVGEYLRGMDVFWIYYPGRGAFRVDRKQRKVELYGFSGYCTERGLYEDLGRVFNVGDLEKILQERMVKSPSPEELRKILHLD